MKFAWGPITTQFNGVADDADPTTIGTPSYPPGLRCSDGATLANSGPRNRAVGDDIFLSGTANAVVGTHSTGHLPHAASFNKIIHQFTVTLNWWDRLLSKLGFPTKCTVDLRLSASATSLQGPANIRIIAWVFGPAGGAPIAQIQHSYDLMVDLTDSQVINIKRDGAPWTQIGNPDMLADQFSVGNVPLGAGNYQFQSELNVDSQADGHVLTSAQTTATLSH